ncbi:MAG: DNA (cytosine-5-)-methyltransferase [Candidatus Pacebacteria bacterium]|nr:DNA (cytosine-5-)-methyltransferase [Candidatus Paceibacterota bacterium]
MQTLINNHIARKVGPDSQKRINALGIGQRMQDLPEELWHESFKYYVKHDENRVGGPNLRIIRLDPQKPSLTVTGFIFNKFVHPFENRYITVREALRLQGFPDDLELKGTLTSTQQQVGNAVPVPLAKAVFEQIVKQGLKASGKKIMTAFSLFSGIGGLDIGAELTKKITTQVALDKWKDACNTLESYPKNRAKVICEDITKVTDPLKFWKEHSGVKERPDIIHGGPPCQSFSQAGKQKGLEDDRGLLIFEFLRFVEKIKPSFFVMENVSNLKGVGGGKLYRQILKRAETAGYSVTTDILLAANYGAPQMRRRILFIGSRKGYPKIQMPVPTHEREGSLFGGQAYVSVDEAFKGLPTTQQG